MMLNYRQSMEPASLKHIKPDDNEYVEMPLLDRFFRLRL